MAAPAARGGVHWGGGILKSDMCASVKAYAIKLLANLIRGIESGSIVMQAEVLVGALIALHLLRPAAPCSRPSASVIQKLQRQLDTCFDSIERRRTIRHRRRHDLNSCLRLTTYGSSLCLGNKTTNKHVSRSQRFCPDSRIKQKRERDIPGALASGGRGHKSCRRIGGAGNMSFGCSTFKTRLPGWNTTTSTTKPHPLR